MKNKFHSWYNSPNVSFALNWLLQCPTNSHPILLVRKSRSVGLLDWASPNNCVLDSQFSQRRVRKLSKNLPDDPEKLSTLLLGLGELAARSHAQIEDILIESLSKHFDINWERVLSTAFSGEGKKKETPNIDMLQFLQWLGSSSLDSNTLLTAQAYVTLGRAPHVSGLYGLAFLSRIALSIDGRAADNIIKNNPRDYRTAAVGISAIGVTRPFSEKPRPKSLLKSRQAAICCIGAVALIDPFETCKDSLTLPELYNEFVLAGLSSSNATWMVSFRLKESIHRRHQIKKRIGSQQRQSHNFQRAVHANQQGQAHEEAAPPKKDERLKIDQNELAATDSDIDSSISYIALNWPKGGLSERQIDWLDSFLVGTAEYRYKLAQKIDNPENKNYLLNKSIIDLIQRFGFDPTGTDHGALSSSSEDQEFVKLSTTAAMSLLSLHHNTPGLAAKKTAHLLLPVHNAISEMLKQPFFSVRKPLLWNRTFSGAVYAYRFALMVVMLDPCFSKNHAGRLLEQALKNTKALLSSSTQPKNISWLTFHLAIEAIYNIKLLPNPETTKENWALDDQLPDYIRAMAVWSSADLYSKHHEMALTLFLSAARLPLNKSEYSTSFNKIINLTDIAIATLSKYDRNELLDQVTSLWQRAYQAWSIFAPGWNNFASRLALATLSDGPERQWLLSDENLMNSYCAKLIRKSSPISSNKKNDEG